MADKALLLEEILRFDARLLQYCTQCALGHIPGMVRHRRVAIFFGVVPDFMASRGLSIKHEFQSLEAGLELSVYAL
jgi:hypothetical protein